MAPTGGLIAAFVRNPVFANLAAVGILVVGVMAAHTLPRETFPETSVDHILISVPYPGSSPADAEQGICIKMEQTLEGLAGTGEISSLSEENSCKVLVAVDTSIRPMSDVLREAQDRVSAITSFPPEADRPVLVEAMVRSEVISVGVYGNAPEATIKRVAEQVRHDLIASRAISQVSLAGVRQFEISIKLTEEALQRYHLTIQQVMDAISHGNLNLPAGTVKTQHEEISVRTVGERHTAQEFEDLVVIARPYGARVLLGQIAEIRDNFEQTPVFGRIQGMPGARVNVSKTKREDISEIARTVRDYVRAAQPNLPEGIHLAVWADTSRDVSARLRMLVVNGLYGMVLVLLCLMVFLDLRTALGVALGIPISYAGAIAVMEATGQTLSMVSLLGLLITTGIIVDDAIVIAESIRARARSGLEPALAAIRGTRQIGLPVFLSSLTTIAAFVPLLFVKGVMGKLIFSLPVVVIAGIVASGFEAFLILPSHLCEWGVGDETKISPWRIRIRRRLDGWIDAIITRGYRPLLRRVLKGRMVLLSATAASVVVCAGLVLGGRTPFVLWPKVDGNTLMARVRLPEGTPIQTTREVVSRLERAARTLNKDPLLTPAKPGKLVQQVYSSLGEWSGWVPVRSSSLCETSLDLMPAELRRVDCSRIIEHWRRAVGPISDAVSFTITRQELGPTEKPLEVRLLGDDLDTLRRAADEVEGKLASFDGVFDITDDLIPGKRELRVSLKPGANNLGLSLADLAAQLRQGLFGGEAVRLQRGVDEVKAVVSYGDRDRRGLGAVENLRIQTSAGTKIPFSEVAQTKLIRGFASIGRQDGHRRVRIQADVDERFANAERIVQALSASYLPQIEQKYQGVSYLIDGQRARINESLGSLSRGGILALVAIYVILSLPLRSYLQPIIIMTAIPLGLVGAIVGHLIMGYDVTLMSVFGMVGLAGIVINDDLVLIDRVNENRRRGLNLWDSVSEAGEARFRAVILTTITTVAGLSPLLLERSSQAQSLIPLTISLSFGLMFSTVLTLFVVPALVLVLHDIKRFFHWVRHGDDDALATLGERRPGPAGAAGPKATISIS